LISLPTVGSFLLHLLSGLIEISYSEEPYRFQKIFFDIPDFHAIYS